VHGENVSQVDLEKAGAVDGNWLLITNDMTLIVTDALIQRIQLMIKFLGGFTNRFSDALALKVTQQRKRVFTVDLLIYHGDHHGSAYRRIKRV